MNEQDRKNIEIARKAYQTGGEVISPTIVWHVPGHSPVSGDYRGAKAYLEGMVSKMAPIEEWIVEVDGVMVNGGLAVAAVRVKGLRKGHRIDLGGAHLLRIENGKVVEGWGFVDDQEVLDAFFSA
jgi:ketosteroid isomerase-like protein